MCAARHHPYQPQHHRRRERPRRRPPSQRANYEHRFGWPWSKPMKFAGFSQSRLVREGWPFYPKALSLRPRSLVCTAPLRVGFEQRLRHLLHIPGAGLPALTPISFPKPPPRGTERPWQLRMLVTKAPSHPSGGGEKKYAC